MYSQGAAVLFPIVAAYLLTVAVGTLVIGYVFFFIVLIILLEKINRTSARMLSGGYHTGGYSDAWKLFWSAPIFRNDISAPWTETSWPTAASVIFSLILPLAIVPPLASIARTIPGEQFLVFAIASAYVFLAFLAWKGWQSLF